MNCRTCDYPLWNLKARQCPECGTAFKPSEFEFVANSVRFCCPQCDQTYYGTGAKGHLVPNEFNCVSCGGRMSMDDAVLRPAAGVEEQQTRVHRTPWLERRDRGFRRGFFGTVGLALVNPPRLVRGLLPQPRVGSAWMFAVVATAITFLAGVVPLMIMVMFPAMMVGRTTAGMMNGIAAFSGFAAMMIVGSLVALLVWALTAHGLLAITGPKHGGFGRTMEAMAYSTGANVISAVPCIGFYVGWIWWLVSATLLVKEAQRVSGGRAALATLPFPLLLVGGAITLLAIAITQTNPNFTGVTTGAGVRVVTAPGQLSMEGVETEQIGAALRAFDADHGMWPKHAIELIAQNNLRASDLITVDSQTTTAEVPLGTANLAGFERLSVVERERLVKELANALPSDTVAHRLGDFVFTFHGVDITDDGSLWLVAMSADPAVNPGAGSGDLVVGLADGSVMEIPAGDVSHALLMQNATRTVFGLPVLPDPRGVRHETPMTSGKPDSP